MRLQNHSVSETELSLEFNGKTLKTNETRIAKDIVAATDEIAGNRKGISHTPLTLLVKKRGVPDLTIVDLPGITGVPVKGQPEDIYEQISNIIFQYMHPKESIILNVLSATVDFSACESIRMSQLADRTGERTLTVVTKADKAPEGLLEKVTADDVNIGLGYVCVRNRVGDETYEEARVEEVKLFESHPLLSKIDKSIVRIPVLAQKLVQIQARSISNSLPDIVKMINVKLSNNVSELNKMPQNLSSMAEAMTAFMRIIGLLKEPLRTVLIRGEYDEYPDEENMHCVARLAELLNQFNDDLQSSQTEFHHAGDLVIEEDQNVGHLRKHESVVTEAFDLKMRMTAYWKIVLRRLVDGLALHLLFSLNKLVNRDMELEIVSEMMGPTGGGIEQMLEESPSVVEKRKRLNKSIKLLKESELVEITA
ncbi:Dynamin, N-terminal [Dillenia turbinata]|uniref:Dynamin, N-terminal n=1 Tax=Dillenia turbinata TaxID=194707 RepID=A0AAN8Z854_9MAGN